MSDSNSPVHVKHTKMVYTLKISCSRLYSILDEERNTRYTYTKNKCESDNIKMV